MQRLIYYKATKTFEGDTWLATLYIYQHFVVSSAHSSTILPVTVHSSMLVNIAFTLVFTLIYQVQMATTIDWTTIRGELHWHMLLCIFLLMMGTIVLNFKTPPGQHTVTQIKYQHQVDDRR